jgi:hypothetical protein
MFDVGTFGDGNPYTILSDDLKSVLTAVPDGAWTSFTATGTGLAPTITENGTIFVDENGDETGYQFTTLAAANAQLEYEGHIKIRVPTAWLCSAEASNNGSQGDDLATAQTVISTFATSGGAVAYLYKTAGASASAISATPAASGSVAVNKAFNDNVIGATAVAVLHTASKDAYVNVDIFWKGKYAFYMVDGLIVNVTDVRNTANKTSIWQNFYLGSDRTSATTYPAAGYAFSNLEIRTKCPEFSLNYPSRNIGVLSDSIFDSSLINNNVAGDVSCEYRILRKFHKQSQYTNITISENGGYSIYDNGSNWLGDPVPIAATLANDPVKVLVNGGTNDAAIGVTNAQFQAAYLDILEKLLGENGNDATKVEEVVCITQIPLWGTRNSSFYAEYVGLAAGYRSIIEGLPALWDATYPTRAGAVTVAKVFEALGGESDALGTDLYKGQLDGTLEDLHLAAHGLAIYGDFLATKL